MKDRHAPEKVMLIPLELRPRVAKDVFFSLSMASSSILVGPPAAALT